MEIRESKKMKVTIRKNAKFHRVLITSRDNENCILTKRQNAIKMGKKCDKKMRLECNKVESK